MKKLLRPPFKPQPRADSTTPQQQPKAQQGRASASPFRPSQPVPKVLQPKMGRMSGGVIQCVFKNGMYVRVNDKPPWYGRVVDSDGHGNYRIRIGGTDTIRQIEEGRLSLHSAVLAQQMNVPAMIAPSRFEVGTHVKVNDNPPWHGQITDWDGRGNYKVRVGGMSLIKTVRENKLELHSIPATMKRFVRPEFANGTNVKINVPHKLPWFGKIAGWDGKGTYTIRMGGSERLVQVEASAVEFQPIPTVVLLRNATFIRAGELDKLDPRTTIVMRAQNTGDMYHIKASMAIHPDFNLLIWNVNAETRDQAQQVVDLLSDLVGRSDTKQQIFYTSASQVTKFLNTGRKLLLNKTETWATEDIESYLSTTPKALFKARKMRKGQLKSLKTGQGQETLKRLRGNKEALIEANKKQNQDVMTWATEHHRRLRIQDLSRRFAFYTEVEGMAFERDLQEKGHFVRGRKYVIVNFRATGHSNRPGANAPALDTGVIGVQQIIEATKAVLGQHVIVVPMGEEPKGMEKGTNLLNYWTWKSAPDRRKQAALLKYLNDEYEILGAIGMRSGVMDQIAFAGIKIISIDISPHRYHKDKGLPDLGPSKGWDRGLKLETAYKDAYGRVFLKHHREDERTRGLRDWKGAFDPQDVKAIGSAVNFYFSGTPKDKFRHPTHPQSERKAALEAFQKLKSRPLSGYDLVNHIHPYTSRVLKSENSLVERKITYIQTEAYKYIALRFGNHVPKKTIEWMSENQRSSLLSGLPNESQKKWAMKEFNEPDEDKAVEIYMVYHRFYENRKTTLEG